VRAVRNIRSKLNVPERKPVTAIVSVPDEGVAARLRKYAYALKDLATVEKAEVGVGLAKPPRSATEIVGQTEVFVPLADLVDLAAERDRLAKQAAKVQEQLDAVRRKLDNPNFTGRAPEQVVQRERDRKADLEAQLAALNKNIEEVS